MVLGGLLCGALPGCSFVLDSSSKQCSVDSDCNDLIEGHPLCQENVCVDAHLGPRDCSAAPLTDKSLQKDFLNACSTSKYEPFDNCARLKVGCDKTVPIVLPPTMDPPTVMSGTLPANVSVPANHCDDGIAPDHVIYMYGAADFAPLLLAAQKSLSKEAQPYRAVFQNASSCDGVKSVFDTTFKPMKDKSLNTTSGGWAFYYNDAGVAVNCLINATATATAAGTGIVPQIGVSDLYAQTCDPASVPGSAAGSLAEYFGPIVQFGFSVPATSGEKSISMEAAHFIFGRGGKKPAGTQMLDAAPWIDASAYAIRNDKAASTVLAGLLAEVPRTKFWGIDRLSTDNLRDTLLAATSSAASSSIGILSIDYNDKNRNNLRALYLQAKNQNVGYLPDSSPSSYDKVNVRDGHYPLWGYVHFFTPLQPDGNPSPAANAIVLKFHLERLDQGLIDDVIAASLVPQCAMKVARSTEMGDFALRDGFSCGCYFDFKANNKASEGCKTCGSNADCTDSKRPACNYGYCEAK